MSPPRLLQDARPESVFVESVLPCQVSPQFVDHTKLLRLFVNGDDPCYVALPGSDAFQKLSSRCIREHLAHGAVPVHDGSAGDQQELALGVLVDILATDDRVSGVARENHAHHVCPTIVAFSGGREKERSDRRDRQLQCRVGRIATADTRTTANVGPSRMNAPVSSGTQYSIQF